MTERKLDEQKLKPREHFDIFTRALRLMNKIAPGISVLQLFQCLSKALIPYVAIYMSARILTELVTGRDERTLVIYVAITIGSTLLAVILQHLFGYFVARGEVKIRAQHDILLANKTYALEYAKAEEKEIHQLRKLIETHARTGVGGLPHTTRICDSLLTNICSIGIALGLSVGMFRGSAWWMAGLLGLAAVGAIYLISRRYTLTNKIRREVNQSQTEVNLLYDFYLDSYLDENKAAKDIRIFQQASFISTECRDRMMFPFYVNLGKQVREGGKTSALSAALIALLGGTVYLYVALQAWNGYMEIGDVVRYYGAITQLIVAASALSMACFGALNNNICLKLLFEYLDLPEQRHSGSLSLPGNVSQSAIEFNNVSFRYAPEAPLALHDVTLRIEPGRCVAIVGPNGSGKSTLVKLLCRLYTPTRGQIKLGHVDIQEYDFDEYQKQFAAVFQDFALFAFCVGQNVAGRIEYDTECVWENLGLAGLKKRVEEFPKQLEHTVYKDFIEDGIDLSGGEEQKLAIARALYKDAPFMILDEPTAALDPFSEAEIYEKFNQIIGEKTALYISHRLSSCKFCDTIIVMDRGSVVQTGTHEELLSNENGLYSQLWNAQAQYYQANEDY